ncbi:MAG: preprotein translocase subunit SecY [Candidatus Aenigmarchaeota archaeon]|nr:preprotein translocase subunit SecY [Candidatus Aenigmarchaeota archaeon]
MNLVNKMPGVVNPKSRLNFKDRLKWTVLVLVLFFLMGETPLIGVAQQSYDYFKNISVLLGSEFGTLGTLGIGPIVTASILLQVLVGAKILGWDLSKREGRVKFQGTQKMLAIAFCFLEGFAYVMFGAVQAEVPSMVLFVGLQIAAGGLIILFLDEVSTKWGLGPGVSLFIAAGVSKVIFVRMLSVVPSGEYFAGAIPSLLASLPVGRIDLAAFYLTAILATVLIFALSLFAQSIKVEIPLAFSQVRGFGRRWPLNLFYTSNMPVILASAFLINISLFGSILDNQGITSILGTYDDTTGQPISGLGYYLSAPHNLLPTVMSGLVSGAEIPTAEFVRAITYTIFLTALCVVFAFFWVETTNMGPEPVADQITSVGMQIPGFRKDKRILVGILSKYIYPLTIMGAIAVGLLAAIADLTGAFGTGTGILLTVMILYNFYERIGQQYAEDMNPAVRKFFE